MIKGSDFLPMPAPGDPPAVTRFAPSPSGYLHLGHAYSALLAWEARASKGRFLLRIEDIDVGRCRPEFEQGIYDDLLWLGLGWDGEPYRQSDHMHGYAEALDRLDRLGVLYPCFCTRRQIRAEIADAGRAPHGPSGEALYPGICRPLDVEERKRRIQANEPFALRLDVARALDLTGPLVWKDQRVGEIQADPASLGDVVLARKDVPTSYHLAVTIDDALQGVTLISRGEDLFHATHIHRLLQALLGLPTPLYYHHNLIADSTGMRIAKRNRAVTLRTLRHMGKQPADIWHLIGLPEPEPAASLASGMRSSPTALAIGLSMLLLAACTSSPQPDADSVITSTTSPWRHWQPGSGGTGPTNDRDISTQADGEGPDAVILALHGFNDYSNAFQDFAAYCQTRNIAVHAYDQRGFGAHADRGRWPGVEALGTDLRSAVARLRGIYGDRPLYILGESMGGAVTIVTATRDEPLDVDGLILSAPAVWGGRHMNLFYRMTLWVASTLAPGWALSPSGLDIRPSDNIEMLRAYSADPMVIKVTRTDAIAGLVDLMDQALASAPDLDRRLLLLIGEKDEIVPEGALDDFRERLETADATVIRYADGYHMLLRDLQREKVFEDVVAWVGGASTEVTASREQGRTKP